jgi:hypothetical protein
MSGLPHISILTLQVKDAVTYTKQSGLMHHLKTTLHQECMSFWYSRIDMFECFNANFEDTENILIEHFEDTENILIEHSEEERMAHVKLEML